MLRARHPLQGFNCRNSRPRPPKACFRDRDGQKTARGRHFLRPPLPCPTQPEAGNAPRQITSCMGEDRVSTPVSSLSLFPSLLILWPSATPPLTECFWLSG